jgi:hypothetical protein
MTLCEQVYEALAEPGTVDEIAERAQLTGKQVANVVQRLRTLGRVVLGAGRQWSRSKGDLSSTDGAAPATARRKRGRKGGRKSNGGNPRSAPAAGVVPLADDPLLFAIDSDGDLLISRRDGAGETAVVPPGSASKLRAFLNRCGELLPA